ncbi:MAG: four helix bundle protein [Saprospiraceae bacterium]
MDQKYQSFEDLIIWKESMKLSVEIYKLFKSCKDFGFKDQIQRSAISVPSNIAEGFERQTDKEFVQYLYIAKGSSGELRTQIYLAIELGYIENELGLNLIEATKKISGMIYRLIQTRKNKPSAPLNP